MENQRLEILLGCPASNIENLPYKSKGVMAEATLDYAKNERCGRHGCNCISYERNWCAIFS